MLIDKQVLATIEEEIVSLLADSYDDPVSGGPDANLYDIGLNSLTLARLIVALEVAFGVDPFGTEAATMADIRTVGELAAAYTRAIAQRATAEVNA